MLPGTLSSGPPFSILLTCSLIATLSRDSGLYAQRRNTQTMCPKALCQHPASTNPQEKGMEGRASDWESAGKDPRKTKLGQAASGTLRNCQQKFQKVQFLNLHHPPPPPTQTYIRIQHTRMHIYHTCIISHTQHSRHYINI